MEAKNASNQTTATNTTTINITTTNTTTNTNLTKSKRFRQFAAGTTQVVRLDDLPESRTRRATNSSTANKKGAGAAVPVSLGSVPFITPQQQQLRKQQQLPPPGNYNRTLTLLVRLSGELCNHLALLANAYRMKRYVEHHIPGLTLQMIGEHQSHDKWIHAYRDLTQCFVNFHQFDFLGGIHDIEWLFYNCSSTKNMVRYQCNQIGQCPFIRTNYLS